MKKLALLGVVAAAAWLVAKLRPFRVEVEGRSMGPALEPGDWAVALRYQDPRAGEVVVVEHPHRPGYEMVKRLTAGPGGKVDGRVLDADEWWIEGDAGASTDSRGFGPVSRTAIRGRVKAVYWPFERIRAL
ncbi:MAG: S26 family signal peptidase [Actinomycetota bacterium]